MQFITIFFTLFIGLGPRPQVLVKAQTDSVKLTVRVNNIPNDKGKVILAVYASKKEFLANSYRHLEFPAKAGELEFILEDLPRQAYALMAYHDENDNNTVDTYFFGLPKEYYGFSNNARSAFGPPSFEDAQFMLDKPDMLITFKVQ